MLSLLSPAKTLDFGFCADDLPVTSPRFEEDIANLLGTCRKLSKARLRKLMRLSPALAELNHERFQNLEWGHSDIEVHMLGDAAAYVTANYRIKYTTGENTRDSMGIATHVLIKEDGAWRIRHSQTASRRRPPGGGSR